jgi:uncharacterized protein (DUF2267 family)
MDEQEMVLRVKARAGLRTAQEARRALGATLGALRGALADDDAEAVARALPPALASILEREPRTEPSPVRTAAELFGETEWREGAGRGFAVEHVQVVMQVLAEQLDAEARVRIRKRLPGDVAALLWPREAPDEAPPGAYELKAPAGEADSPPTLSRGRAGTADSIAGSRHPLAHEQSVARTAAPHADRAIGSAHAPRAGGEEGSLASARPHEPRK